MPPSRPLPRLAQYLCKGRKTIYVANIHVLRGELRFLANLFFNISFFMIVSVGM